MRTMVFFTLIQSCTTSLDYLLYNKGIQDILNTLRIFDIFGVILPAKVSKCKD